VFLILLSFTVPPVAVLGEENPKAPPAESTHEEAPQEPQGPAAVPKGMLQGKGSPAAASQGTPQGSSPQGQNYAGEFFGIQVPIGNYYFVKGALMVFGNKWGPQPTTAEELESCVWNDLLLSYEAFRKNIEVKQEEVDEEITKILRDEGVKFDWRKDKEAYAKWLKDKTGEPPELFQNQLKHLIQLKKLRDQVMDGIKPEVSEEEAHQEFLNEYNTLSVELAQFNELKDAEEFYKKVKANPKAWEEEKAKRPKDFKRPGFVSLEFLMDLWKFQKDAVYKMMQTGIGDIYPLTPVYKGYGVFKVLEKRPAEEAQYPKLKESYHRKIESKKKYQGLEEWIKNLKEQANIKPYPIAPPAPQQETQSKQDSPKNGEAAPAVGK
jgi:hypothetical protein